MLLGCHRAQRWFRKVYTSQRVQAGAGERQTVSTKGNECDIWSLQ